MPAAFFGKGLQRTEIDSRSQKTPIPELVVRQHVSPLTAAFPKNVDNPKSFVLAVLIRDQAVAMREVNSKPKVNRSRVPLRAVVLLLDRSCTDSLRPTR